MKQKRTFIAILLVIAVLALGIAYANLEGYDLTVNGSAKLVADAEAFKVQFTEGSIDGSANKVVISSDGKTATLNFADFTAGQQTQVATLTISNLSNEYLADVTVKTDAADLKDYFDVTTELVDGDGVAAKTGTATYTVTVKALKAVTAEQLHTISAVLTATPVAP